MPATVDIYLGFDPGGAGKPKGKGNFGWSICYAIDGRLEPPAATGLAKEAWDALTQVKNVIAHWENDGRTYVLHAAGIDAPLFWNRVGKREIDNEEHLGARPIPIGAMFGAAAVQGPLLSKHLNDTWPSLTITECYPKALELVLASTGKHQEDHQMLMRLTDGLDATPGKNHERDATLAAISAWAAIHQDTTKWRDLYLLQPDPINPFDLPVSYWMPIPR